MRQIFLPLAAAFLLVFATSCDQDLICTSGDGNVVTETLDLGGFTGVDLRINGNVTIQQGERFLVEVTGEQNMLDRLETNISNQVWDIDFPGCNLDYQALEIKITMPEVSTLKVSGSGQIAVVDTFRASDVDLLISGSGNIVFPGVVDHAFLKISGSGDIDAFLVSDKLESSITGSGDIFLKGDCPIHDYKTSGSGKLFAFDFVTDQTNLKISGSGDAEVLANQQLDVQISGSGDVYYKGNPALIVEVTGSGNVEKVD